MNSALTYSSAQWCSYTRQYYYSKAYLCTAGLNYLTVSSAKSMLGAIIGGVVGGLVFIIILICICCYCCCKKAADATKQVAAAAQPAQINITQQPMMQPVQPMMMQPQPMMMQPAPVIIKV